MKSGLALSPRPLCGGVVVWWSVSVAALICVTAQCAGCTAVPTGVTGPHIPATLTADQATGADCAELSGSGGNCGHKLPVRESEATVASAASPPALDTSRTCKNAGGSREELTTDRATKACLDEENVARNSLTTEWSKFKATHKSECTEMVSRGGPPSYVELITCVEAMDGADAPGTAFGRDETKC